MFSDNENFQMNAQERVPEQFCGAPNEQCKLMMINI